MIMEFLIFMCGGFCHWLLVKNKERININRLKTDGKLPLPPVREEDDFIINIPVQEKEKDLLKLVYHDVVVSGKLEKTTKRRLLDFYSDKKTDINNGSITY